MNKTNWWSLKTDPEDLTDVQREHIANMIRDGFTSGEIIEEDDYDEN